MRAALACVLVAAVAAVVAKSSIQPNPSLWSDAELDAWCSTPSGSVFTPQCGGFIGGIVWADEPTNCSFVLLDNETDKTRVVDSLPTVCADVRPGHSTADSNGFTSFDTPTKQILFATGEGSYVYGVNVNGQGYKQLAALPASYPPLIGLAVANGMGAQGAWYVVTQTSLLQVVTSSSSTTQVMDLTSLKLSTTARVAAFNTTLYVIDALTLHVIDLTSMTAARPVTIGDSSLLSALTIQYWPTNNTVVTVSASRVITQIDLLSGRSYPILTLPAGTGAIDRSTSFFDMYFVTDSASMYLVNLAARTLETSAYWPGSTTKSNIQYYY